MFRSNRQLRKIFGSPINRKQYTNLHANQRGEVLSPYLAQESIWCHPGSYAERFPPLSRPLPGLNLLPFLPESVTSFPTKITRLENGLTIASEYSLGPSACIGIFIDCGSIYELGENTGSTHHLEKLAFRSTKNYSHLHIMHEVEATGGNIGASASREQMGYVYDTLKSHLPHATELLVDCIRNPLFLDAEVQEQVAKTKTEVGNVANDPQNYLLESLHSIAYTGPLGNPLVPPSWTLDKINASIIREFYQENYTSERIVLAASGVDHDQLLDIAVPLLYDFRSGPPRKIPKSLYVGGDFRCRADSLMTHVALAFEVQGGWTNEKNSAAVTILQTLMGGGGSFSAGGPGKGMHSRLYRRVLNKYCQFDSCLAFNSIYNDTGLFGIHVTTGSDFIAKAVIIAAKELVEIAISNQVTAMELQRAKNATKSSILMNLESRMIITEDIGRQILTHECRKPVEHFLKLIDDLTLHDITTLVQNMLSSPLTLASWGDVDGVPSYDSVCRYLETPS